MGIPLSSSVVMLSGKLLLVLPLVSCFLVANGRTILKETSDEVSADFGADLGRDGEVNREKRSLRFCDDYPVLCLLGPHGATLPVPRKPSRVHPETLSTVAITISQIIRFFLLTL